MANTNEQPKIIEINKEDSYMFIRFQSSGSAQFGIDMSPDMTPTQLFAVAGFLQKHAEIGLVEQIAQVMQEKQRNKIIQPNQDTQKGILR